MESLADTDWDVTISGTGLPQSLLALALSRSGKKVLHVDKNDYYGGPQAAFSLDEAAEWLKTVNQEPGSMPFERASIYTPAQDTGSKLGHSRSYTLSLSPQVIYARSELIPTLVSSKVYRQLEFHAVGSWWVFNGSPVNGSALQRVPSSREDVFSDDGLTMKSKRSLMKFLRYLNAPQEETGAAVQTEEGLDNSFVEFMNSKFQVPTDLLDPLLSLALSPDSIDSTTAAYAMRRIKRHLGSFGIFGPGFGSVLAKWGGGSELCQVGCRASAVGGGVYVLNTGVSTITRTASETRDHDESLLRVHLSNGQSVPSKFVVGSPWDVPSDSLKQPNHLERKAVRSINIVSSSMNELFPPTSESGPIPAGAVVFVPGDPPVYLLIHSSDSGECPIGQCIIYASTSAAADEGQSALESAVNNFLASANVGTDATLLWSLRYTQIGRTQDDVVVDDHFQGSTPGVLLFPPPSLDLAFDEDMLHHVRLMWKAVLGDQAVDDEFMKFQDREGAGDGDGLDEE